MTVRSLLMTTVAVPEVVKVARAWCDLSGFEVRAEEPDATLDERWGLRRGGAAVVVAGVSGHDRGLLRFVESAGVPPDPLPVAAVGPIGVEFFSRAVDEVVDALRTSPVFRAEGKPRSWEMSSLGLADGRSAHVTGPAGLHFFLTTRLSVPPPRMLPPIPELIATPANMFVSATDRDAVRRFYGEVLGLRLGVGAELRSEGINRLVGIDPDSSVFYHLYLLPDGNLSEHNIYPPATSRGSRFGTGQAVTGPVAQTFEIDDLDQVVTALRQSDIRVWGPHSVAGHPYHSRRVAVTVGPSNERVELVETDGSSPDRQSDDA